MIRDKEATKQRLIDAVGKILAERGFHNLGVNAIAKEAGVDKVLIYRYFDSLEGLLQTFLAQKDYFSNLQNFFGANLAFSEKVETIELSKRIFIGQLRQVLHNKELQEVLLWELNQKNALTDLLAETRETQGRAVLQKMEEFVNFDTVDFPAIGNLIIGGIYYLVLRSRSVDTYSGINLTTDEGWQRIEKAIVYLLNLVARDI